MKLKGMSYATLARLLYLDRSTIYWMLKQKSIDSERLYLLSKILHHDFFAEAYQPLLASDDIPSNTLNFEAPLTFQGLLEIIDKIPPSTSIDIHLRVKSSGRGKEINNLSDTL